MTVVAGVATLSHMHRTHQFLGINQVVTKDNLLNFIPCRAFLFNTRTINCKETHLKASGNIKQTAFDYENQDMKQSTLVQTVSIT